MVQTGTFKWLIFWSLMQQIMNENFETIFNSQTNWHSKTNQNSFFILQVESDEWEILKHLKYAYSKINSDVIGHLIDGINCFSFLMSIVKQYIQCILNQD